MSNSAITKKLETESPGDVAEDESESEEESGAEEVKDSFQADDDLDK